MKRRRLGKRGNVFETLFFTALFFSIGVLAVVSTIFLSGFNDELQAMPDASTDAKTAMQDYNDRTPKALDSGLLLAYFAGHIGIIVLGLLLRSTPILYPFLFIALVLVVALSGYLSNAYDDIASDSDISVYADLYPKTSWLLDNFLMITLIAGFFDLIAFVAIGSFLSGARGI